MRINYNIEITNEDNMKLMARYPDNYFDLAVVDPPYGKNIMKKSKSNFVTTKHKNKEWDNLAPKKEYFIELKRVSKNQIIWGVNYFPEFEKYYNPKLMHKEDFLNFKDCIIWDKLNPMKGKFSDCEMAYVSTKKGGIYSQAWIGFGRKFVEKETSIHPTQKPIRLYEWIFSNYAKKGYKIIDTNLGSGSIVRAIDRINKYCQMNLSLVACEIDKEYYQKSIVSIQKETANLSLFLFEC